MKVKELIKILQKEDPERLVVLSCDEEGNYYSPLSALNLGKYNKESHAVGLESLTRELEESGYSEEDVMEDGVKALILYP